MVDCKLQGGGTYLSQSAVNTLRSYAGYHDEPLRIYVTPYSWLPNRTGGELNCLKNPQPWLENPKQGKTLCASGSKRIGAADCEKEKTQM